MQRAIITLLQEIKEKYELTMLFVTHDLNLVSLIADRIGVMYAFEFAEIGPVQKLMRDPSHPYTRGLLNSAPNVSAPIETMSGIPGTAPNPKQIPSGCSYQERCPIAEERCKREDPDLRSVEESDLPYEERSPTGHRAACFYPERSRAEVECYLEDDS
jgi:oligopeptide/dipeptide ABC transporter ATP-binding protein